MKKPNFFIVGAAKAGTTSVYHYLSQHPEVYLSPIKEPNYFAKDIDTSKFIKPFIRNRNFNYKRYLNGSMSEIIHQAWIKEEDEYLKLFKNSKDEKAIGESSVIYLFSKVAAKEIHKFNPKAKIIILLRNPVERTYSHYLMDLNSGVTDKSLLEIISDYEEEGDSNWGTRSLCIESGFFYNEIKRYLDIFPRSHIKILFFEDLKRNPKKFMTGLYKFLNVRESFEPDTSRKHNPQLVPKLKILGKVVSTMGIGKIIPLKVKKRIERVYFKESIKTKMKDLEIKKLKKVYSKDIKKLRDKLGIKIPEEYYFKRRNGSRLKIYSSKNN